MLMRPVTEKIDTATGEDGVNIHETMQERATQQTKAAIPYKPIFVSKTGKLAAYDEELGGCIIFCSSEERMIMRELAYAQKYPEDYERHFTNRAQQARTKNYERTHISELEEKTNSSSKRIRQETAEQSATEPCAEIKIINTGETEEREKRRKHVNFINGLLKASFGRFYRGDYGFGLSIDGVIIGKREEELDNIGRCFLLNTKLVGEFQNKDGSIMQVPKRYERQAREYARLYKEKTGKVATVILQ